MLLLILRPEPGAAATRALAEAAGWRVITAPLFVARARAWEAADPGAFDAVVLTSAHAARLAGPGLAPLLGLPVYAVGTATARAARDAGFVEAQAGTGDAMDLLAMAARDGRTRLLHLAGREHRDAAHPATAITRRIVYAAEAVTALPAPARAALGEGALALLHSPRAAVTFRALVQAAGLAPAAIRVVAISAAARDAAGAGWRAAIAAAAPTDAALLAAAAWLCEEGAERTG